MNHISTSPHDWREKNDKWQKRHFLLSSFVRLGLPIKANVYEFIDYLISQGYKAPLNSLTDVDNDIKKMYNEYVEHQL